VSATSSFDQFGAASVYMAAGYRGLLDVSLVQLIPGSRAAGPARTVRCGQDDNLMVHAAMSELQAGEVLVITMPEPRPVALIGELLATQASVRGAAAILVDGAVRDSEDLVKLGLPIWARWVRVRQASKDQVGAINLPVEIGGTTIAAGDIVVLDADGAVVVQAGRAAEVLEAAAALVRAEGERRRQFQAGALSLDVMGLRPRLDKP
jgi:4-hydroxy-4-methyl-2-oxoglutarate aldolase